MPSPDSAERPKNPGGGLASFVPEVRSRWLESTALQQRSPSLYIHRNERRRDLPAQAEGNRRLILSLLAVVVLGSAFSILAAA